MNKILVSDYDDTFYINDKDIKNNIELVEKYKDNFLFIIATGRSYLDYINKKDLYNINSKYVILNHGATILKDDELIFKNEIDNDIKEMLLKDLEIENSISHFTCRGKESRLTFKDDNLTKINIKYKDQITALRIYNKIKNKYGKFVNCFLICHKTAIEIVDIFSDKKNAILKLIDLENISNPIIYTVGNGDTDYEMLKFFHGFAMKKSTLKVKSLNLKEIDSVSELINIII